MYRVMAYDFQNNEDLVGDVVSLKDALDLARIHYSSTENSKVGVVNEESGKVEYIVDKNDPIVIEQEELMQKIKEKVEKQIGGIVWNH